jgi:hypothetical protein
VIEYGGGINNGPAGQVGGSGGGAVDPHLGTSVDFFSSVGNVVNDAASFLSAQPLEVLVAGFFVVLIGLAILRRAF